MTAPGTRAEPAAAAAKPPKALRVLAEITRRFEEEHERTAPIPSATPAGPPTRLTVGMASYDDFDGVFFTAQALRLYHPEVADSLELIVVDNHPEGAAAADLARLADALPGMRYIPFRAWRGTAARDLVFREASAEHVVCLDSHVLLVPGALAALVAHLEEHPADLVQGPLLFEDGSVHASHFAPVWQAGMFGRWALDERVHGSEPFDIPMSGLGVFACHRDAWPGFNPHFRGFGGEEGYIHEKVRQRGGRTMCVPAAGWVHRFARPSGLPYHTTWDDRIRNYLIGWAELGLDDAPIHSHVRELIGDELFDPILVAIDRERTSPLSEFDAIVCIQRDANVAEWPDVWARLDALGAGRIVERLSAVMTPDNHHDGCARSHRAAIADAKLRGLDSVLVVEEDAVFLDETATVLHRALAQLGSRPWDVLYLGGVHQTPSDPVAGCDSLQIPTYVTCTHAVAYHARAFDRLLQEIPADASAFAGWLDTYTAIDQYLATRVRDGALHAYVVTPRVASQPLLLQHADADLALADRYTIR